MPDRYVERSVHEVLELAKAASAAVGALRDALFGVRPRLDLKGMSYEVGRVQSEFLSETDLLAYAAQVLEGDMPLGAQLPDGDRARGVISPRQLSYLASLAPQAAHTVRYSELLAATSQVPRLEQDVVDQVAAQENLDRRMGVTCALCGSGPGEFCRSIGGIRARRR